MICGPSVQILSQLKQNMTLSRQMLVYTRFIRVFLTRSNSTGMCFYVFVCMCLYSMLTALSCGHIYHYFVISYELQRSKTIDNCAGHGWCTVLLMLTLCYTAYGSQFLQMWALITSPNVSVDRMLVLHCKTLRICWKCSRAFVSNSNLSKDEQHVCAFYHLTTTTTTKAKIFQLQVLWSCSGNENWYENLGYTFKKGNLF